ncbi:unnamed protein product (macronuclear) [Paramecium tetraurelia]|uniref:Response regulatory domain-containing protein n=1 Tax=Paramecium tetraurelia TaxID=5888 RepID=A0BS72_PARTE|nr:uncharacterized protein GSPATT00031620001 [Paramecium tetraurelia]CAK61389.1 unnamed protein product [Paramecium tetraurelia]|eukprot:XP_001428787.1 hypothetical protein (macronuclear) [Paramecium tetraurelia strain d4-2]
MLIYTSYLYVQFSIKNTFVLVDIIMNKNYSLQYTIISSISLAISVLLLVMETLKKQNIYANNIGASLLCVLNIEFIYNDIPQINMLQLGTFIALLITQFEDAEKWHKFMKHSILVYFFVRTFIQYKEQLYITELLTCFLWQPLNHWMLHLKKEEDRIESKKHLQDMSKYNIEQIPQLVKDQSEQDEQCSSILRSLNIQHNLNQLKQLDLKNPFVQDKENLMNNLSFKGSDLQKSTNTLDLPQIWNLLPFGIGLMNSQCEMVINNQKLLQFLKVSDNDGRNIILNLDSLLESCESWESKSIKQVGSNQSNRQSKRFPKVPQLSLISRSLNEQNSVHNPEGGTNTNLNNNIGFSSNPNNQIKDELMTTKSRFKNLNLLFTKFAQKSSSLTNNVDNSVQSIGQNIQIIKIIQDVGTMKYYLRIKVYEIEINNKIYYLFLIENITNKEELRQLNIRYKYQQALLNSLCHELRTPMNSTLSQLNALSTLIAPNIRDKNLQPAIISAKKLMFQLNDILDYAQIDCRNFHLSNSQFELSEIFEILKELFEQECKEKQLDFQLKSKTNYMINSDKERILRILVNLIDNSIKFTNQCGSIQVNVSDQESRIIFQVEDNGVGMSEKTLYQIKNRDDVQFYDSQLFQQTKLGLGLKISQQIAKFLCYNNELIIESTENEYTRISFKIENQQKLISQQKFPSFYGCNITISCNCTQILIVDDVRFNHSAIEALLSQHKMKMDSAYNGQQAIEKIEQKLQSPCCKTYKLIFMDIEMPVKNGYQASKDITEIMTQQNMNDQCAIVMCSAYNGNENNDSLRNCGIKEILPKPIEQKQLKQLLDKYLL